MDCVDGNDDSSCGNQSSVTWPSLQNEIYYLLIHGGSSNNISSMGEFQLSISTDFDRKSNDFCNSAKEVKEESIFSFSLTGSTADQDLPPNDDDLPYSIPYSTNTLPYGIWFKYQGTGDSLFYSFNQAAGESIAVIAFSGACGDLYTVRGAYNYWGTSFGNTIETCIPTNAGEAYYIFAYTTDARDIDNPHVIRFGKCQISGAISDHDFSIITATVIPTPVEELRFNFRFGFFDGVTARTPDMVDVQGAVCATQRYFDELTARPLTRANTKLREISWDYYEGQNLPVHLNFTVGYLYEDDAYFSNDEALNDYLQVQLAEANFKDIITNYIWNAEPGQGCPFILNAEPGQGCLFHDANRLEYDSFKGPPVLGDLPLVDCTSAATASTNIPTAIQPQGDMPTAIPTQTAAP